MISAPNIFPEGKTISLLIFRINLKIIQEAGKQFYWKKPDSCPDCRSPRLWGHGFVLRYFFGYVCGLWVKRWRCPDCRAVHTARPREYTPGIQYPQELQKRSLETKLSGKPYLKIISRQIQQHWKKIFLRQLRRTGNWNAPLAFFNELLTSGQFHLTKRTIYCETWSAAKAPYLSLALTVKRRFCSLE